MQDETQHLKKADVEAQPASTSTETVKTTKEIVKGNAKSDESMIMGASGRFWITFVLTLGLFFMPLVFMFSQMDATLFNGIYTSFIGVAGMAIGTYLGQNKPKSN